MKEMFVAVLVVLAFVAGYLAPKQNILEKNKAYHAGNCTIYYRTYKGKGGKTFQKIDIQGKHNLMGNAYQNGATIESAGN